MAPGTTGIPGCTSIAGIQCLPRMEYTDVPCNDLIVINISAATNQMLALFLWLSVIEARLKIGVIEQ